MSRRRDNLGNPVYSKGRFAGVDVGITNATREYLNVLDYYLALAQQNNDEQVRAVLVEVREKFSQKYNNLREHNIGQLRLSIAMLKDAKEERKQERLKEKANGTNN
jgi:uncharacterized glyoxalase superfamily metalloenzyme YdcJ